MKSSSETISAINVSTRFVSTNGRTLAYRELGSGTALILCLRFRGVLDSWDPAFLDNLAKSFRVITFDYSGLGQSTGDASYQAEALARDAMDLADALAIQRFVIGGWSLGGLAAQVVATTIPERISHVVLIGTSPPGKVAYGSEPIFLEHALRPDYDLEDEIVLFFEPTSDASRKAAAASHARIASRVADRSPAIRPETYMRLLTERKEEEIFPDRGGYREFLATAGIPILVVSGDHEIVFPVENWFELNQVWKSLHLLVLPQMGHGPQHEAPDLVGDLIASFVATRP